MTSLVRRDEGDSGSAGRRAESVTLRDAVQLLASAAGLSVYLLLLGGIVYWGQLASAGLPADAAVATADPPELMAVGLRSL